MSIDRWMAKEHVVYIYMCVCVYTHTQAYNEILLSHEKELIWVSSNEVDEPRAYYVEWSKSERERQIY